MSPEDAEREARAEANDLEYHRRFCELNGVEWTSEREAEWMDQQRARREQSRAMREEAQHLADEAGVLLEDSLILLQPQPRPDERTAIRPGVFRFAGRRDHPFARASTLPIRGSRSLRQYTAPMRRVTATRRPRERRPIARRAAARAPGGEPGPSGDDPPGGDPRAAGGLEQELAGLLDVASELVGYTIAAQELLAVGAIDEAAAQARLAEDAAFELRDRIGLLVGELRRRAAK